MLTSTTTAVRPWWVPLVWTKLRSLNTTPRWENPAVQWKLWGQARHKFYSIQMNVCMFFLTKLYPQQMNQICFLSHGVFLFLQQTGELFYVGLPSSYSLPTMEGPLPRLPSYESVRKKDRQRQIHIMIADRFGLNGPIVTEVEWMDSRACHSLKHFHNAALQGLLGTFV